MVEWKAAMGNTKTKSDQATQLNFDLKPVAEVAGKHRCKIKESTWSGCPRPLAVIRVAAGSRFLMGLLEPGILNVKRATARNNCSVKL